MAGERAKTNFDWNITPNNCTARTVRTRSALEQLMTDFHGFIFGVVNKQKV
jgi:hypothetical protein